MVSIIPRVDLLGNTIVDWICKLSYFRLDTLTYIMVDMHAHTDTRSHSHTHTAQYTNFYHHTHSGRSQSHPRSVLIIKEVSNGSGEKITVFVSLSSTTTVYLPTRPTPTELILLS